MNRLTKYPIYLPLLTFFFVLHGYLEHHRLVLVKDAFGLAGWYLLVTAILYLVFWRIYKNREKAALMSFALLAFNFFFGALHDLIKRSHLPFIERYSVLLPVLLILFIILFVYLKRSSHRFLRVTRYLNVLLIVVIAVDAVLLITELTKATKRPPSLANALTVCEDCPKPDIYLIVADSYPGNIELKDALGYDNSDFEGELRKRGFHVVDSSNGNYNMTTTCIAALLDMRHVEGIRGLQSTKKADLERGYEVIRNSAVPEYLRMNGYHVYNHSIFDLHNAPAFTEPTFLPRRVSNITSQTFIKRILNDLGFHLIDDLKLKFIIRYVKNSDHRNNQKVIERTTKIAGKASDQPRFVYTHVVMPHYPYYYDSLGKKYPLEVLNETFITNTGSFISYLKYANTKYLELIDQIRKKSKLPPIIILMGDHGFREFPKKVENRYHFMNLLAVHLPDGNYSRLYQGMSSVNLFRVIFNGQFRQQLPLLKDSTSFLLE